LNYICTFGLTEDRKYKRVEQASTSQREQYGGIVHLFIGTWRSLCRFTFMSFITGYNHDTDYHVPIELLEICLFKTRILRQISMHFIEASFII
jgi:hypothetical protein